MHLHTARRKLIYLSHAEDLQGLFAPPGNRLGKLKGDRTGHDGTGTGCAKGAGQVPGDGEAHAPAVYRLI